MRKLLSVLFAIFFFLPFGLAHADSYSDGYGIGYAIGQAIGRSSIGGNPETIPTEEYKNDAYNAGHVKSIFLYCFIGDDYRPYVEYPDAIRQTTQVFANRLKKKGFKIITCEDIAAYIAQQKGVGVNAVSTKEIADFAIAFAKQYMDATCQVHILAYRMIYWNDQRKADAALDISISDPRNGATIFTYTRETLRADLPLARNSPKDMVEKVADETASKLSKKISADKKHK